VLTRTYGSPGAELDLRQRGCVPSGLLTAAKARVLLVLLLRSGYSRQETETWLMSEGSQRAAGDPGRVHA
jgi:L-asparaginase